MRRFWRSVYWALARAVTAYVSRGESGAAAYVRGGVGTDDFLSGLSDVDTVVVLDQDPAGPGVAAARARRRWKRLHRALPVTELLVEGPMVFEEPALRDLCGALSQTSGRDLARDPALRRARQFGEGGAIDWLRMLERPGLYRTDVASWRLLAGPDRRPPQGGRDAQLRRIAAWLELLFWWRWVFPVCIDPSGPRTAGLCLKLVAEPTRIWLWLAHGERVAGRVEALEAGLRRLPEEEDALRLALDLHRSLPRSPEAPLTDVLPALVRISSRIAHLLNDAVRDEGVTEVRLAGADSAELLCVEGWRPIEPVEEGIERRLLPLADWRSLVRPQLPDESFAPLPGDPGDPGVLAAAAASQGSGPYPALRSDRVMVLPADRLWRTRLRAIQCPTTDPVSFAVADGEPVAMFPRVSGWSAEDTAHQAVGEHRAWLRVSPGSWRADGATYGAADALGVLLTAARAALFEESVAAGEPELPLTATATARRLAERSSAARAIAEDALGVYREFALRRTQPPQETVSAMRGLVCELAAYADLKPGSGP
jgi:hypothetical protein